MIYIKNFISKFHYRPEYIGICGIILTILGTVLPAIYIANVPMSYIRGDGKFIALLMIIVGVLMYKKKAITSLIPTILACIMTIRYVYTTSPSSFREAGILKMVVRGPGVYLLIIGLCLCLAYGVMGNNVVKEKEQIKFNIKYFLIGFIFPIIGLYFKIIYNVKKKEVAQNSLMGSLVGIVLFLFIAVIYSLNT